MSEENGDASAQYVSPVFARARKLESEGWSFQQAFQRAVLEEHLANWPEAFGQNLKFLLFGDFQAPEQPISVSSLRITVDNTPIDNKAHTWLPGDTILQGTAVLSALTVEGLLDAISRINVLLGMLTLISWGNSSYNWWSWMIHGGGDGVCARPNDKNLNEVTDALRKYPLPVRRKIESALYWIRESQLSFYQRFYRTELRVYAAYWNAFECLVDAICLVRPPKSLSPSEKQAEIESYLANLSRPLSTADIDHLFKTVVNPGLVFRASHAIALVFNDPEAKIDACFKRKPRHERLYDIRNAINHGDIDAENPSELSRVDERRHELWRIVWGMFGALLPPAAEAWRPT